jgi:hypothetical protein
VTVTRYPLSMTYGFAVTVAAAVALILERLL